MAVLTSGREPRPDDPPACQKTGAANDRTSIARQMIEQPLGSGSGRQVAPVHRAELDVELSPEAFDFDLHQPARRDVLLDQVQWHASPSEACAQEFPLDLEV